VRYHPPVIRNALTLAWIFIKQPGLALMVWRARHDIPELRKMLRAIEIVDRQSGTRER